MSHDDALEVKPGDMLAGKYRVDRVIGAGGMGIVVQATHTVLNDKVALKFLLPDVLQNERVAARFLREAQSAVRIKSPHVARVIDVGTLESGSPYMVMEYLEGKDLSSILESEKQLEPTLACYFALQTCEALAAAHSAGVIHRDIKPANLFITKGPDGSPQLKVLDFGISKAAHDLGQAALTQTQVSMGSPLYMSPEQMRSARDVDARADIWSVGVVLYEMLTGTLPFMADSMPQLCALVLETTAPPLRLVRQELPAELEAVVARCLERDADARFPDIAALAEALAPFGGEHGFSSAARISRIMDSAGLGPTLDIRNAMPSVPPAMAQSQMGLKTGTSTAFGKTKPPQTTPPPATRNPKLLLAAGAVGLLVLVGGGFALSRGGGAAAAAASAGVPPSVSAPTAAVTAPQPVASPVATPDIAPAPSASVRAAPSASSEPDKPRVRVPGPLPKPKSTETKKPGESVYDERQ